MKTKKNKTLPAVAIAVAALMSVALTGCSAKPDTSTPTASVTPRNVKLTPAQLKNIQLYTIQPAKYHKTIETSGAVDFDNDQATSVLAPFSGPASRLLVSLGDRVKKGDPLAEVESSDFAAAISAYSKALATAKTNRHLADLDKDLLQHHGVAQKEADQAETDALNAEADRDAALQALVSLSVHPKTIKDIQEGRPYKRARRRVLPLPTFRASGSWRRFLVPIWRRSISAIPPMCKAVSARRVFPAGWTTSRRWWIPTPVR
jgi:membrane fusion protein, heavy metal efflux system